MSSAPEFITPIEAARILGVRDSKLRHWIETGELPAVNTAERPSKLPRYKISRAAFNAFLERRTTKPKPMPQKRHRIAAEITEFV